jgi:AraC-like DNA-binding protein
VPRDFKSLRGNIGPMRGRRNDGVGSGMNLDGVDVAVRGGAVALLALLAGLLLRDLWGSLTGRLAAGVAVGSAAYAVTSSADFAGGVGWWRGPLVALANGDAVAVWLFARALFEEGFALRGWHAALWAAVAGVGLLVCSWRNPWLIEALTTGLDLTGMFFLALAVGSTVASWSGDLVEGRRRLRLFIVAVAAVHGGVHGGARLLGVGGAPLFSAVQGGALLLVVLVVVWSLTRADGGGALVGAAARDARTVDPIAPSPPAARTEAGLTMRVATAEDERLAAAVVGLMEGERLYRQDGLTIGVLAGRLGVAEHRLRRVINQTLGHRNFNVFLNGYRLAEVKAALADPAQDAVPITTMALDAGFQSLGPFNRAFKSDTGLTPSEYRSARVSVRAETG